MSKKSTIAKSKSLNNNKILLGCAIASGSTLLIGGGIATGVAIHKHNLLKKIFCK